MFSVTIAGLDKVLYEGEADSVTLPAREGEITVLKNHVPLVSSLKEGNITVRHAGSNEEFKIKSGIIEVSKKGLLVLL
jgi:F-type H+-transporting ATPase subunit epsilon